MPLDAQDKLTLETMGRAWDKAIQDTGASEMRAKLAVSGRELTRAILELCPAGISRKKALDRLSEVIVAIRACQDEQREPMD
jgi:hypothetical protein